METGLALAGRTRVVVINRKEEFARCKEGNLALVLKAIKDGRLDCRYGTSAVGVAQGQGGEPLAFSVKTPAGPDMIDCNRIIARPGATAPRKPVERFGAAFPSAGANAGTALSDTDGS